MTHEELCERARRWLSGSRRCDPVFSNIASCREIPDAIGWSSCYQWEGSTVVECKTSIADFHADRRKYVTYARKGEETESRGARFWYLTKRRAEEMGLVEVPLPRMGDFRYYFCDEGVIPVALVEKHAPDHGLIYVCGARRLKTIIPAPRRKENVDLYSEIRYLRFAIINRKQPHELEPEAAGAQAALFGGEE